jgi:large subunit ribosomal protein L24
MKIKFSKSWKASRKKRKQVKYVKNAPLHIKNKFISIHLSKELRQKYNMRNITAKKGDKVKIVRGSKRGKTGKISDVDMKNSKIFIEGIDVQKTDGTKVQVSVEPSNTIIIDLNLEDKKRQKSIDRKKVSEEKKEKK